MKTSLFYALMGVAIAMPAAAFANQPKGAGHYEWRTVPQYGPRSTGTTQRRVWVPDSPQAAGCDCDMMKHSAAKAAECMKEMHSMASPSQAPSAG